MIELVAASRRTEREFWTQAALGLSLRRLQHDRRLSARLYFENARGLPDVYNERIRGTDSAEILVFVHDDVWIDDCFFADRLLEGLQAYDVLGVAGNRRRVPRQPAWVFVDEQFTWDQPTNLSGRVSHGANYCGQIAWFGNVPAECELLDGLLLASRKEVLLSRQVTFDSRFAFHFYDLDFCRLARDRQLRLGTWPIGLTHESSGAFGSANWKLAYQLYLQKWGS
ncbi:MAG: hypothetical protein JSS02_31555 [Planctomycetes bacterium]|nr:hypothetical protein [Planctomycetota bacterium]